jgi:putative peptidoglycan lipid II flippase
MNTQTEEAAGRILRTGLATIVVGLLIVLRDRLVAERLGIGGESDSLYLALAIPALLASTLTTIMQSVFIPALIHRPQDRRFISQTLGLSLALGLGISILYAGAAALVHGRGVPALPMALSGCAMVVFQSVIAVWGATLQAGGRHAVVALAPSLPIAVSIAALFVPSASPLHVLHAISIGYLALAVLMALAAQQAGGAPLVPSWPQRGEAMGSLGQGLSSMFLGTLFFSGNLLVDQVMSARLGDGMATLYVLGSRLPGMLAALGVAAASSTVLVQLSTAVRNSTRDHFRTTVNDYALWLFALSLIPTILFALFTDEALRILLGAEALGSHSDVVAAVARIASLQIPLQIGGLAFVKALNALQRHAAFAWLGLGGWLLNIALNLLLGHFWGVQGIAASTVIVYCFTITTMWHLLRKERD